MKERISHIIRFVENSTVIVAAAVSLAKSTEIHPTPIAESASNWYGWYVSDLDAQGCATIRGIEIHQVTSGEVVQLNIQPVVDGSPTGDAVQFDFSGRPAALFTTSACPLQKGEIIFQASRDGVAAPASMYVPSH
jgi:hypothetical protein